MKHLWSIKRKEIYTPINEATVFIGPSRIKFDLDIPTWESITGEKALQLSFVGTSPRPLLDDLAKDEKFAGKVIIDITEGIFFDRKESMANHSADKAVEFYKDWTPAERFSSSLNNILETNLIFLDKDKFSLNALLRDIELPKRKGVFMMPLFPRGFEMCHASRQNFMTADFVRDTVLHNRQIAAWRYFGDFEKGTAVKGDSLTAIFKKVKVSIDKDNRKGRKSNVCKNTIHRGILEYDRKILHRAREERLFDCPRKILIRQTGDRIIATLDYNKLYAWKSVFVVLSDESKLSLEYLLILFNSSLINFYYQKLVGEVGRAFAQVKGINLDRIPIKMISVSEQQPFVEKADLMLKLNKELLEANQKFQRSVERKFELTELSKKLQYWYTLTYAEFIKELAKKKIKPSLSDEAEWENYFEQEKQKAVTIRNTITATDHEIDEMVYELYGLTEEEIKIVEGV